MQIKKLELRTSHRANGLAVFTFAACLLSGCTTVQQMREGLRPKPLFSRAAGDKAEIYGEIAAAQKRRSEAYVQIVGSDIELPPTPGQGKPADSRKYTIDVWFDDSVIGERGISEAIRDGEIVVEVLGAKASVESAPYGSLDGVEINSRGKVHVELDSRDLTQSFNIIAKAVRHARKWQQNQEQKFKKLSAEVETATRECKEDCQSYLQLNRNLIAKNGSRAINRFDDVGKLAMKYLQAGEAYEIARAEQNPYMAVKTIRVFNGDLHTQVYMLSDEEARDGFGTNFSRYFYVGKAYFRNRHNDKKLIVNTTSLRARTVFYREPVGDEDESWRSRLTGKSAKMSSDLGAYGRYDYILAGDQKTSNILDVGEENTILSLARSKAVIDNLLEFGSVFQTNTKLEESILRMIDSSFEFDTNAEKKQRATEFIGFALQATWRATSQCKPPSVGVAANDAELYEKAFLAIESNASPEQRSEIVRKDSSAPEKKKTEEFVSCIEQTQRQTTFDMFRSSSKASPIALDMRKRVGLTEKIAAASRDTYWQQRLARHGYLWQDYYRPMTLEAVLLSLSAKTKSHPNNRILEYLQSIGVVAGSLVGLSEISSRLASEAFAQRVAVTTGVFLPEIKKLIMRDLDQYLANLAATALPSIISLGPNDSRDGYVFFPRGPIYGYGVDEFSINEPSYIVNIDNDDVAVDGALIEAEVQFAAGQKAMDMIQAARNQGTGRVSEDLKKMADLQARIFSYRLQHISNDVCEMIASGNSPAAVNYINAVQSGEKASADSQLIAELKARAAGGIACDKPLPTKGK